MGVQVTAFNAFRFLEAEPFIVKVRDDYRRLFGEALSRPGVKDEHLARLEGTLGQIYAFEADLSGDETWAELAEMSLRRDVDLCVKGSPHHDQGLGYLTVFYWKRADLERAVRAFLEEAGEPGLTPEAVFNLNADPFHCARKPFLLLHRLALCALARHRGLTVSGAAEAAHTLLAHPEKLPVYPVNLQAKWATVLLAQEGKPGKALDLVHAALEGEELSFTLELVRLPLRMLEAHLRAVTGESPDFSLPAARACLAGMSPGADELLSRLPFDRFDGPPADWKPYRIGALLPFYFS
jgi:hypothetical protein